MRRYERCTQKIKPDYFILYFHIKQRKDACQLHIRALEVLFLGWKLDVRVINFASGKI